MEMRNLRGKNIVAAGYDPVTAILRTRFGKSGEYDFTGVPEDKFISLCRVPYPDKYFTQTIKGKFPSRKVPDLANAVYDDREDYYTKAHREMNNEAAEAIAADTRKEGRNGKNGDERCRTEAGYGRGKGSSLAELQNASGRVCDGSTSGDRELDARQDRQLPGDGKKNLPDGRCNAQSTGGRVMEVFFPADGVTFTEEGHYYTLKGQRVPFSLTQILELSGISRQPTAQSEIAARPAAAKRGTKVHEYTLWLNQGELDLDDLRPYPEYYNRVIGWQQFCQDFHFMPDLTFCEVPIAVRCNGMLYAMKLDAYGVIGEGENIAMAVVEKKCTADAEDSHAIQTAGQAIAFKAHAESVQLPLKRFVVYLFDKENSAKRFYRCVEHTDRTDEKVFVGAGLTNCYWRQQHGLLNGKG